MHRFFHLLLPSLFLMPLPAQATPVAGHKGVVATAHPAATDAGHHVLTHGGNAADAAAAAAFALAVVEPYSSGLGGGGFALTSFKGVQRFIDFREVAPDRAHRDMYLVNGQPHPTRSRDGALSVAVPGAVAGYLELQEKFGRLSRKEVIEPALKLAEDGFAITPRYLHYVESRLPVLLQDPEISRIFLVPSPTGDGLVPPPIGHILKQPDLAATLRTLIKEGAPAFYTGALAHQLVEDMTTRGGLISAQDLSSYEVRYRTPLVGSYRGHRIVSSPPPSSGGQILLTLLNIMETLPTETPWRSTDALHLYIEGAKRAFADRALLGDPLFLPHLERILPSLLTKDRAQVLARVIGDTATPATEIPAAQGAHVPTGLHEKMVGIRGHSQSHGTDTSHLSVVDEDGNAVSLTTTINYRWGSCVVARNTGIVWNDEMDDFSIAPGVPNVYGIVGSEANAIAPRKTPLSSMSPTMVFTGPSPTAPLQMVLGSPGGSRIPTTVAQAIMHFLDYDADIERAISLGRVHHQHLPDLVFVESLTLSEPAVAALRARGHILKIGEKWSNATGIALHPLTGVKTGAADPRGIGTARAH